MKKITFLFVALLLCMGVKATPTVTELTLTDVYSGLTTLNYLSLSNSGKENVYGEYYLTTTVNVNTYKGFILEYKLISGSAQVKVKNSTSDDGDKAVSISSITDDFTTCSRNFSDLGFEGNPQYISVQTLAENTEIQIKKFYLIDNNGNEIVTATGRGSNSWEITASNIGSCYLASTGWVTMSIPATDYNTTTDQKHTYKITFSEAPTTDIAIWLNGTGSGDETTHIPAGSSEFSFDVTNAITGNTIYLKNKSENCTFAISSITRTVYTYVNTLYDGDAVAMGDWKNFENLRTDNKGELANIKIGDVIRLTCTNATSDNQVNICNGYTYTTFTGYNKSLTVQEGAQTVSFEINDAETVERIIEGGIVISGKQFTLTKVELITDDNNTTLTYAPITITSAGVATYNSSYALDFTDKSLKAYIATNADDNNKTVTMTRIYKVPANTGLYLVGDEDDYEIPYYTGDDTESTTGNLLVRTYLWKSDVKVSNADSDGKYRYILAKQTNGDNSTIGFYEVTTSTHKLADHKAYLETNINITHAEARVALIFDDEETTGIQTVEKKPVVNDNVYYTLSGQRVQNPTKGLYIVNGKKVFIK